MLGEGKFCERPFRARALSLISTGAEAPAFVRVGFQPTSRSERYWLYVLGKQGRLPQGSLANRSVCLTWPNRSATVLPILRKNPRQHRREDFDAPVKALDGDALVVAVKE